MKLSPDKAPPTYLIEKSYEENYENGPRFEGEFPGRSAVPFRNFMGFKVNSCFGIPAGPLLNSKWIELYGKLGFDLLVYKTVRTAAYPSHPPPNCRILNLSDSLTTGILI